jgi:hypothetical protein
MPAILPAKNLKVLKYYAGIFPEYIHLQARFDASELIRWKFPNNWGASLVTVDPEAHFVFNKYHYYYDDYDEETDPLKEPTELISLSFFDNKEGQVYYNNIVNSPLRGVNVSELVIILSRLIALDNCILEPPF